MATYFWTGQALNADGSVFVGACGGGTAGGHTGNFYNYWGNWKKRVQGPTGNSGGFWHFTDPVVTEFPTAGDEVYLDYLPNDASIVLSGGPFPRAPLLFGGCRGTPGTGLTWSGETQAANDATGGASGALQWLNVHRGYHQHFGAISGDYIYSMGGEGTSGSKYSGMRGYDSLRINTDMLRIYTQDSPLHPSQGIPPFGGGIGPLEVPLSEVPEGFKSDRVNMTKLNKSLFTYGCKVFGGSEFQLYDSRMNFLYQRRNWGVYPNSAPDSEAYTKITGTTFEGYVTLFSNSHNEQGGGGTTGGTFGYANRATYIQGYGSSGSDSKKIAQVDIYANRGSSFGTPDHPNYGLVALDCDIKNLNIYPSEGFSWGSASDGLTHAHIAPVILHGSGRHTIENLTLESENPLHNAVGTTYNNPFEILCGCTIESANVRAGTIRLHYTLSPDTDVCITDGFLHGRAYVNGVHPGFGSAYTGFRIGSNQGNTVEGFNIVDDNATIRFPEGIYVLADYAYGVTGAMLAAQAKSR